MPESLPRIQVTNPNEDHIHLPALDSPISPVGSHSGIRSKSQSSDGNNFSGGRKSPIKLLRTGSNTKVGIMSNPASPPPQVTSPTDRASTAIDPLSHHILKRTNTENTIPQKLRNPASSAIDVTTTGLDQNGVNHRNTTPEPPRSDTHKDKKKGVSFLSRFSIKKKEPENTDEDESEHGDQRIEGMNAHVFSSSLGANGYIPRHKEPRFFKVRAQNTKDPKFNHMFLAQELAGHRIKTDDSKAASGTTSDRRPNSVHSKTVAKAIMVEKGAIWATEFSRDGKYLAAAGEDQIVRIWAVLSTHDERTAHEHDEDTKSDQGERLNAPVFASKPVREFEGHSSTVLDLSWSKNNFLLSSSMDKTVRLWHVSRQECLCTFKHKDFVTSIAFHPMDDRFFLAGSLDSVLRLWSIPDKSVAFWNQLPDLITAVAFSPDGKTAIAGVLSGLCLFYETEGLRYNTQIHVRSSRGKNAKGSKITGIRCCVHPHNDLGGETKVLITTNDSRVRMYNLRDKSLEMKFRGHENSCSQIKATVSDDSRYIICGSEDRKAYIWPTGPVEADVKDKRPVEFFEAHTDMVTTTVMAPLKTRQLLSQSGDPLYDLCNPPPVTLLSRAESNVSSRPPTVNEAEKRLSDPSNDSHHHKKPEESPAYLARSRHEDGNILVTADHSGNIKVFRQDCAYHKRRNDTWEAGSTISKRLGGTLSRPTSMIIGRQSGQYSRRNSTSQGISGNSNILPPSDRILSWRNNIGGGSGASLGGGDTESLRGSVTGSIHTDRSASPGKNTRSSSIVGGAGQNTNLAGVARQSPYIGTSPISHSASVSRPTSPPRGLSKTTTRDSAASLPSRTKPSAPGSVAQLPTPGFTLNSAEREDINPLNLDVNGKSNLFWHTKWTNPPRRSETEIPTLLRPGIGSRGESVVSVLTDEMSDEDSFSDCQEFGQREDEANMSHRRAAVNN